VTALRLRRFSAAFLVASLIASLAACLAPTLPIPPPSEPELSLVSGKINVVGDKGSVQANAQVYVINTTLEQKCAPAGCTQIYSRIVPAAPDGSYSTQLDGQSGDTISVSQQVGDSISGVTQEQVP
jgi:hypothetical protein